MGISKKILLADDHAIVSKGLSYLFSLNFPECEITEARGLKEMLKLLSSDYFTHLILDLNLSDGCSLDYIPEIIKENPLLDILIYSMAPEDIFGRKILAMNTSGFLSKTASATEVVRAITIFLQGGVYKSSQLKQLLSHSESKIGDNIFLSLSASEFRVLALILKGKRTKEISNELKLADQTIGTFKSRIFKKLGTDNIFEINKLAELNGANLS
jgi:two-component system invasion response regulator UvrY